MTSSYLNRPALTERERRLVDVLQRLASAFVNPGDGAPFEDGEVPELDDARALLSEINQPEENHDMAKDAAAPIHPRHKAPEGECVTCDRERATGNNFHPPHDASPRCESGWHNHCTCDTCF